MIATFLASGATVRAQVSPRPGRPAVAETPARTPAAASSRPAQLRWRPGWRRFDAADWVATSVAGAAAVGFAVFAPPTRRPARLGIDESARDALRFPSEQGRVFARDASDVLLSILESYNFLVDTIIVASWYRRSPGVGWQMALINGETLMITGALQGIANFALGRERPYVRDCPEGDQSRDCTAQDRYRSFFSGHASQAFTSAALLCGHHARMPLYGGGAADLAPCLSGLAVAGTVSLLRVMGDMHYLTDVLTGAALGTTVGFVAPWLLHFLHDGEEPARARRAGRRAPHRAGPTVMLVPMVRGVSAAGTFE